jgi:hypothetical protein
MTQNRKRQREREQRRSAEHRADTDLLTAEPFRIWDTIKQFHPHKKEILIVVRMLNKMGAKHTMIAAALDLQGWQSFCGVCEWTDEDVEDILNGYRA